MDVEELDVEPSTRQTASRSKLCIRAARLRRRRRRLRRRRRGRSRAAVADDIDVGRGGDGATAAEESEYDALNDRPEAMVHKARERFEEYENTQEWHEKIKADADNSPNVSKRFTPFSNPRVSPARGRETRLNSASKPCVSGTPPCPKIYG